MRSFRRTPFNPPVRGRPVVLLPMVPGVLASAQVLGQLEVHQGGVARACVPLSHGVVGVQVHGDGGGQAPRERVPDEYHAPPAHAGAGLVGGEVVRRRASHVGDVHLIEP